MFEPNLAEFLFNGERINLLKILTIKRSGHGIRINVFDRPTEIYAVLIEHLAIQNVFTIGVPHETLDEIIVACVVLKAGQKLDEEYLRSFAKERLASYKAPRKVLFFAENEFPMTGISKIRRPELPALVAARLKLNNQI